MLKYINAEMWSSYQKLLMIRLFLCSVHEGTGSESRSQLLLDLKSSAFQKCATRWRPKLIFACRGNSESDPADEPSEDLLHPTTTSKIRNRYYSRYGVYLFSCNWSRTEWCKINRNPEKFGYNFRVTVIIRFVGHFSCCCKHHCICFLLRIGFKATSFCGCQYHLLWSCKLQLRDCASDTPHRWMIEIP